MVRIRKSTLIAVEYIERGEGGRLPVADETGAQSRQIVPVWNLKRSNWELHTDQRPSERKFESVKAIQIQIKRQTERGRKKERERERNTDWIGNVNLSSKHTCWWIHAGPGREKAMKIPANVTSEFAFVTAKLMCSIQSQCSSQKNTHLIRTCLLFLSYPSHFFGLFFAFLCFFLSLKHQQPFLFSYAISQQDPTLTNSFQFEKQLK